MPRPAPIAPAQAHQAVGASKTNRQQHRAQPELPVDRVRRQTLLEQQEHGRAQHAAVQLTHAAQDHHDHQHAGLVPLQQRRTHEATLVGHQRAGQTGQAPGQRKGRQLVAQHRKSDGHHARLVLADRQQHVAETRV